MECQRACLGEPACIFAMYKTQSRKCSYYEVCTEYQRQAGFVTWEKECDNPEPPHPNPEPPQPNPACAAHCSRVDIKVQGVTCGYFSKFPRFCEQTLLKQGNEITLCQSTGAACEEGDVMLCPGYEELCEAGSSA